MPGVTLLLMVGGAYLCFEAEKVAHRFLHSPRIDVEHQTGAGGGRSGGDLVAFERTKISSDPHHIGRVIASR
jgi:predicted DNA repair protein MutK